MKCLKCDGDGFYADHAGPEEHTPDGECQGSCPVKVQCEACQGTGETPKEDNRG